MNTIFRIRELRQMRDMTQAQLAKAMNLKSPSTVTMWESGDRKPSSEILPRLARVLGCTVDDLYIHNPPDVNTSSEGQKVR